MPLHPLTLKKWEPQAPIETVTARLLLASVRELFFTRLREVATKPNRGVVTPELLDMIHEDRLWVYRGGGQEPYTLDTFCAIFQVKARDFRALYQEAWVTRVRWQLFRWEEFLYGVPEGANEFEDTEGLSI